MSDLTDIYINMIEQRFPKWACDRLTEDADFGKKKNHLFR